MFTEIFATACSNFCLVTLCVNGLFLVGSLSNSFHDYIKNDPTFLQRFSDKGRLTKFLSEEIPIYLVTDLHIGLKGCEEFGRRLIEEN